MNGSNISRLNKCSGRSVKRPIESLCLVLSGPSGYFNYLLIPTWAGECVKPASKHKQGQFNYYYIKLIKKFPFKWHSYDCTTEKLKVKKFASWMRIIKVANCSVCCMTIWQTKLLWSAFIINVLKFNMRHNVFVWNELIYNFVQTTLFL